MEIKNKILLIPSGEVDEFGAIINCAVRYCIGRESYMPHLVINYIRKHPEMLDAKSIYVMIQDIQRAKDEPQDDWEKEHNRTALGLDYQRDYWLDFLSWLREQEEKINERENT